jgi:hypothetical protein
MDELDRLIIGQTLEGGSEIAHQDVNPQNTLGTEFRWVRHGDFTRNREARGRNAAEMPVREHFDGSWGPQPLSN